MCTSSTTIKDCVFKLDGHLKLKCNLDQLKKGEINKQIKYLKTELNSDLINIFNSSLYLHTLHCVTFTLRRIIVWNPVLKSRQSLDPLALDMSYNLVFYLNDTLSHRLICLLAPWVCDFQLWVVWENTVRIHILAIKVTMPY